MNRFLYALGNPATLIDPTGHAGCNPGKKCTTPDGRVIIVDNDSNVTVYQGGTVVASSSPSGGGGSTGTTTVHTPAPGTAAVSAPVWRPMTSVSSGCTIEQLTCSVHDFEMLSAKDRIAWLMAFEDQYGVEYNFTDWFNAIFNLINFADEENLIKPGGWFSVVDAHILNAIEDGLFAQDNGIAVSDQQSGAAQWQNFFISRVANDDLVSRELWGVADQTATDYGNGVALGNGLRPDNVASVAVGLGTGNIYRAALSNARGVFDAAEVLGNSVPFIDGTGVRTLAEGFFDPRSLGPTYYAAKILYATAQATMRYPQGIYEIARDHGL